MVQAWFRRGSGAAQVRFAVGRNTSSKHRAFHVSFNGGWTMVQVWFRRGAGVVQTGLRRGAERKMQSQCLSRVFQGWFHCGSGVVHVWFRRGSGAAQLRLGVGRNTNCSHHVFHVSFTGGSPMVQAWFRRGSGAAEKGIGTQNANVISFTRCSRMVPLLFRCGSCVVQVLFRCGPGGFGRESEYQLRPWRLPRVVQW